MGVLTSLYLPNLTKLELVQNESFESLLVLRRPSSVVRFG